MRVLSQLSMVVSVALAARIERHKIAELQQTDDESQTDDRSLCILLDDTGSMGPDIRAVRTVIDRLLHTSTAPHYVLVSFNDPQPNHTELATYDRQEFHDTLRRIRPSGGGDCPEMFYGGALRAIELAHERSNCFLFTDAPAKDTHLQEAVANAARAKNIHLFMYITPGCGSPCSDAGREGFESIMGGSEGGLSCVGSKRRLAWYIDSPDQAARGQTISARLPTLTPAPALWRMPRAPRYIPPRAPRVTTTRAPPPEAECGEIRSSGTGVRCTCDRGVWRPPKTCTALEDTDFGDIPLDTIFNLDDAGCCEACSVNPSCVGSVLTNSSLGSNCYLKSAGNHFPSPGRTSFVRNGVVCSTGCGGICNSDEQCEGSCGTCSAGVCTAGPPPSAECGELAASPTTPCRCGGHQGEWHFKEWASVNNTDLWGDVVGEFYGLDEAGCAAECFANSICVGAVLVDGEAGGCFLKNKTGTWDNPGRAALVFNMFQCDPAPVA